MTCDSGADLPNDLLGAIYSRCSSSHHRARFAAVCKSWRAAVSWQPKLPSLPLLLPSTGNSCLDQKARAYSPEVSRVLRSRLPWFPNGKQVVGSYDGGWIAAATGGRIEIVNVFTRGCRMPVKAHIAGGTSVKKVAFSEDPTSEGCILAAMTTRDSIAVYRLGCPGAVWTTRGCDADESIADIVFCNGELYGLSCLHEEIDGYRLYKLAIGIDEQNAAFIVSFNKLTIQWPEVFDLKYIFELHGRLAAAVKVRLLSGSKARIFKVFKLVASSSDTTKPCTYVWAEVTSLGDHALLLGPGCCKAVHVSAGRHGTVQGNRIYYSKPEYGLCDVMDPSCIGSLDLGSCAVFCYENQGAHHHMDRIISRGYHYHQRRDEMDRNTCTWIWPPQF